MLWDIFFFHLLIDYSYSSLVNFLLECFTEFLLSFTVEFENSLYILNISPLSGVYFPNNFLLVCAIFTHFLHGIF